MPTSIDLDDLRALRNPLVIYVGAELTRAAGLPSRRQLARVLVEALPDRTPQARQRELRALADADDLCDVFTELERDLTAARFGREVERALNDRELELPALAQALAGLGARVQGVVTPNLDRLIERAFASRLETHVRPSAALLQREDWLLKINGTIQERSGWVFTREQRARARVRDPIYAKVLRALFMSKPILFVGTPIDDPIFDEIVDHVRDLADGAPPQHWALLPEHELTAASQARLDDAGIASIACANEDDAVAILASLAPDSSSAPAQRRRPAPRRPSPSGPLRILFVAANPADTASLALDHEQRVIREAIARSPHRDRIQLEVRTAASFGDLSRAMLDGTFEVVHLAGHGDADGLILDEGGGMAVLPAQLAGLLDEYAAPTGRLRCVVLNACWSDRAGVAIAAVPSVVTMSGPLDDRAALAFTEGFYDALGVGRDFAAAYQEGMRRGEHAAAGGPFAARLLEQGS